jgi:hypothetical protein
VSFTIDLEDWNLDRGIETESVIYEYPKLVAKKA